MTIRLLSTYEGFAPNSIITLDSAIETALIADGNATATLTGGACGRPPCAGRRRPCHCRGRAA